MSITADDLDRAALAVLDHARAETHTDAPQPPDDEDDGDQEAAYLAHLDACERCQMEESIQASRQLKLFTGSAVMLHAEGAASLNDMVRLAIAFGIRVGMEVERQAATDPSPVDGIYEAMRADLIAPQEPQ